MHSRFARLAIIGVLLVISGSARVAAAAEPEDFVGVWAKHGFVLEVREDGRATANWRTYKWCRPGVAEPCDEIRGNEIYAGGHAEIEFRELDEDLAAGVVLSSSQPEVLDVGRVTMLLAEWGMAILSQGGDDILLCGPHYAELAPPDIQRQAPCGA